MSEEKLSHHDEGSSLMSEEGEERKGISFLTENRFPPTIATLGLGYARAMGPKVHATYSDKKVRFKPAPETRL